MEKQTFIYQYSASRNREVESIRRKYIKQEESDFEKLKRLDSKVQHAGVVEGLIVGLIGVLVFGIGMCFGLDVFAGADWLTLIFCSVGIAIMLPAYPLYKYIYRRTKNELVPEILRLSDEIVKH